MKKEYIRPVIKLENIQSEDIIMRSWGSDDPLEVIVDWENTIK